MLFDLYFNRITLASVSRIGYRNAMMEAGRPIRYRLQEFIER